MLFRATLPSDYKKGNIIFVVLEPTESKKEGIIADSGFFIDVLYRYWQIESPLVDFSIHRKSDLSRNLHHETIDRDKFRVDRSRFCEAECLPKDNWFENLDGLLDVIYVMFGCFQGGCCSRLLMNHPNNTFSVISQFLTVRVRPYSDTDYDYMFTVNSYTQSKPFLYKELPNVTVTEEVVKDLINCARVVPGILVEYKGKTKYIPYDKDLSMPVGYQFMTGRYTGIEFMNLLEDIMLYDFSETVFYDGDLVKLRKRYQQCARETSFKAKQIAKKKEKELRDKITRELAEELVKTAMEQAIQEVAAERLRQAEANAKQKLKFMVNVWRYNRDQKQWATTVLSKLPTKWRQYKELQAERRRTVEKFLKSVICRAHFEVEKKKWKEESYENNRNRVINEMYQVFADSEAFEVVPDLPKEISLPEEEDYSYAKSALKEEANRTPKSTYLCVNLMIDEPNQKISLTTFHKDPTEFNTELMTDANFYYQTRKLESFLLTVDINQFNAIMDHIHSGKENLVVFRVTATEQSNVMSFLGYETYQTIFSKAFFPRKRSVEPMTGAAISLTPTELFCYLEGKSITKIPERTVIDKVLDGIASLL